MSSDVDVRDSSRERAAKTAEQGRVLWHCAADSRFDKVHLLINLFFPSFITFTVLSPPCPGVSVPVHSCVLSAFSPWLCGSLSAMPSPRNGQRRLIEVQTVEASTLLSLVSLLYSGQLNEDKEDVLSAACKLGIDIPQQVSKRPGTERNTQTECMEEVAERECQTEAVPSECQNPKETIESVNLMYTDGSDITLATLQNIQGNPKNMPSFQVMDVVPESAMYPTASGPACLPQVYVCPLSASYQQPPTPLPPQSYPSHCTNVEPLAREGQPTLGGILEGEECVLETFARFENNIPGFINYFIDTNITQGAGQREQSQRGMRGDFKTEGRVRRAGARGGFALKGEGLRICKREQNMNRCGRVARSAWMGQGGGRVGRILDTRQMFKNQEKLKRRRQGRGAMKEEGEGGRSRGRPRQRQTGSRGRLVEPVCQVGVSRHLQMRRYDIKITKIFLFISVWMNYLNGSYHNLIFLFFWGRSVALDKSICLMNTWKHTVNILSEPKSLFKETFICFQKVSF